MANLIGRRFGQYEIVSALGAGGMGEVYLARDLRLNRQVAVKILPLEAAQHRELLQRFQREASAAAGLDHPNIIDVYDLGEETGVYYIVMRYVNGPTVDTVLQREGPFPPQRVLRVLEQLTDALDYAHQRGIVHRDIKPANVMLERDDFVTLTDFGIAHAPSPEKLTMIGQVMGTAGYMAPEQAAGHVVDQRADIYALGVLIEEMLTGKRVEFGQTPAPALPAALREVLTRSRATRAQDRYPSVRALYTALQQALSGAPESLSAAAPDARRGEARPAAGPPSGMSKLTLADGREYPLTPGVLRLGRAPDNDIVLRDEQVSRQHAEIHTDRRGSVVIDMDSTNGVFINEQRVPPRQPCPLTVGTRLKIGKQVTIHIARGEVARPVDERLSTDTRQRSVLETASSGQLPRVGEHIPPPPLPPSSPPAPKRAGRPWWVWGGGCAALLLILGLSCGAWIMFGARRASPTSIQTPARPPTSTLRPPRTLPVQITATLKSELPTSTSTPAPKIPPTATPRPSATPRPTHTTAPPLPTRTTAPPTRPPATTPPQVGNVFEFVNYTDDQSCHFEFWGPASYTVDVGAGSSKTITNVPNGEYGWKTFITGVGESRSTAPTRMSTGGRCTITCSKRDGKYYTGSYCTP